MRRVATHRTGPEDRVALALRQLGVHYRRHVRSLPGRPDFANRTRGWAIFVHGCYWHHHAGCAKATVPRANRALWLAKFATNRQRDARKVRELRRAGFRVLTLWECATAPEAPLLRRLGKFFDQP